MKSKPRIRFISFIPLVLVVAVSLCSLLAGCAAKTYQDKAKSKMSSQNVSPMPPEEEKEQAAAASSKPQAAAEEVNGLMLSDQTCSAAGEEVTFTILINNAPNAASALGFEITYDGDILEYKGITRGELVQRFDMFDAGQSGKNTLRVGGVIAQGEIAKGASGALAELTFSLKQCRSTSLTLTNLADDFAGWPVRSGRLISSQDSSNSSSQDEGKKEGQAGGKEGQAQPTEGAEQQGKEAAASAERQKARGPLSQPSAAAKEPAASDEGRNLSTSPAAQNEHTAKTAEDTGLESTSESRGQDGSREDQPTGQAAWRLSAAGVNESGKNNQSVLIYSQKLYSPKETQSSSAGEASLDSGGASQGLAGKTEQDSQSTTLAQKTASASNAEVKSQEVKSQAGSTSFSNSSSWPSLRTDQANASPSFAQQQQSMGTSSAQPAQAQGVNPSEGKGVSSSDNTVSNDSANSSSSSSSSAQGQDAATSSQAQNIGGSLLIDSLSCTGDGEEVTFSVLARDVVNKVATLGFEVGFNGNVLKYEGFTRGDLTQGFTMFDVNQPEAGKLRVAGLDIGNGIGPGASGTIVNLTFKVNTCTSTSLHLSNLADDVRGWQVQSGQLESSPGAGN